MTRILRETVPVDDRWHTFQLRGPIVHVATRHEDAVEFWYVSDDKAEPARRTFLVVGTEQPVPDGARYVRSAVTPSGQHVWHLVERTLP